MQWERKGVSRNCFPIGRYAIKLPKLTSWESFLWGLLANLQEVRFSSLKYEELCPVLFYLPLGLAVVMPKCTVFSTVDFPEERIIDLIEHANQNGRTIPVEIKPDSWGLLNERLVAVDYG